MSNPATIWFLEEIGRLIKGIGSAFIKYADWLKTGVEPKPDKK